MGIDRRMFLGALLGSAAGVMTVAGVKSALYGDAVPVIVDYTVWPDAERIGPDVRLVYGKSIARDIPRYHVATFNKVQPNDVVTIKDVLVRDSSGTPMIDQDKCLGAAQSPCGCALKRIPMQLKIQQVIR